MRAGQTTANHKTVGLAAVFGVRDIHVTDRVGVLPRASGPMYMIHLRDIYYEVIANGILNFRGARVPRPTNLHISQWNLIVVTRYPAWELWLICAHVDIMLVVSHIPGESFTETADALSHFHMGQSFQGLAQHLVAQGVQLVKTAHNHFSCLMNYSVSPFYL